MANYEIDGGILKYRGAGLATLSGHGDVAGVWEQAALQFWGQLQEAETLIKERQERIEQLKEALEHYRNHLLSAGKQTTCSVPQQEDPVNNPKHYQFAPGIEAIDVIEAILTTEQFRGYCIGNALKYRLRAGDKGDTQQDIDKSKWYQNRARSL